MKTCFDLLRGWTGLALETRHYPVTFGGIVGKAYGRVQCQRSTASVTGDDVNHVYSGGMRCLIRQIELIAAGRVLFLDVNQPGFRFCIVLQEPCRGLWR